MAHFGDRLREERERRGIALEDVARSTKVAPHMLEALESNQLDQLPGGPFNKGFVRSYALALGLDPDEMVDAYTREEKAQGRTRTPDADRELMQEMARLVELRSEGDRRTLVLDWSVVQKTLIGAAVAAVAVLIVWLFVGRDAGARDPAPIPVAAAEPAGEPAGGPAAATTAPEPASSAPPPAEATPLASPQELPAEPLTASPAPAPDSITDTAPSPAQVPADPGVGLPPDTAVDEKPASPEPPAAMAAPASRIRIEEAGVGTGVRGRLLVGRTERFRQGDRVWFWNRAMDGRTGEIIRHVWMLNGEVMDTVEIRVGGPHWRNWSWKTMTERSVGDWLIEVLDETGQTVQRLEFTCLPSED